jgi:hypothetical protein
MPRQFGGAATLHCAHGTNSNGAFINMFQKINNALMSEDLAVLNARHNVRDACNAWSQPHTPGNRQLAADQKHMKHMY